MALYKTIIEIVNQDPSLDLKVTRSDPGVLYSDSRDTIYFTELAAVSVFPKQAIKDIDKLNILMDGVLDDIKKVSPNIGFVNHFGYSGKKSRFIEMGSIYITNKIASQHTITNTQFEIAVYDDDLMKKIPENIPQGALLDNSAVELQDSSVHVLRTISYKNSQSVSNDISERVILNFFPSKQAGEYVEQFGRIVGFKSKYLGKCDNKKYLFTWGGLNSIKSLLSQ